MQALRNAVSGFADEWGGFFKHHPGAEQIGSGETVGLPDDDEKEPTPAANEEGAGAREKIKRAIQRLPLLGSPGTARRGELTTTIVSQGASPWYIGDGKNWITITFNEEKTPVFLNRNASDDDLVVPTTTLHIDNMRFMALKKVREQNDVPFVLEPICSHCEMAADHIFMCDFEANTLYVPYSIFGKHFSGKARIEYSPDSTLLFHELAFGTVRTLTKQEMEEYALLIKGEPGSDDDAAEVAKLTYEDGKKES